MGYLRVRRSVRVAPGLKLNLNKRSVGLTVGGRGAHYSVNTRGQRTTTMGLPGTGVSYIDRSTAGRPRGTSEPTQGQGEATGSVPVRPGIFARHSERAFYQGIHALSGGDAARAVAFFYDADRADTKHRTAAPALLLGLLLAGRGEMAEAIPYLERALGSDAVLGDRLMAQIWCSA